MTRENQSDSNNPSGKQAAPAKDEQKHESGKAGVKATQHGPAEQAHVQKGPSHRGFAAMDESRQRDIASAGGRAAHEKGTAHEFDSAEARIAGRKGGEAVSENREHMAEIGRKGGEARQAAASQSRNASQGEGKSNPGQGSR